VKLSNSKLQKVQIGLGISVKTVILSKALFTHDMIDPKLHNFVVHYTGKQVVVQDLDYESELVTAVPELTDDSAVMRCVLDVFS